MTIKALTGTRAPKFGTFLVEFATPGIGHILKAAGCDFVLADMEHSGFGIDTVKTLLRALEAAALPAIVGMPGKNPDDLARCLDIGAEAVMSPMVDGVDEARIAAARTRYPPRGTRAVSVQVGHDRYAPGPVLDKLRAADARTVYFAKIETVAGLDAVEEIAALDGLDGLWIGHYDLSVSMGIPGAFDDPRFAQATARIVEAALTNRRALGRIAATPAEGLALIEQGFDFIAYSGDAWLLQAALADGIARMRQARIAQDRG
ncbi:MAG: aldolase/citrate lyase family protein [Alphaproteobacteria bacterium]